MSDAGALSRAQGCILGQLAGDALGGLVESGSAASIRQKYPSGVHWLEDGGYWNTLGGQPTDDSEMVLALARSILNVGSYDPEAAARSYAWWYDSDPYDIGGTTSTAISAAAAGMGIRKSAAEASRNAARKSSQANGALMRVSPLGILVSGRWYDSDPYDIGGTTSTAISAAAAGMGIRKSAAEASRNAARKSSQANGALMRVSPLGILVSGTAEGCAGEWAQRMHCSRTRTRYASTRTESLPRRSRSQSVQAQTRSAFSGMHLMWQGRPNRPRA